jgi:hypothetical protein
MPKQNDPYSQIAQPLPQAARATDPYARVVQREVLPPSTPEPPPVQPQTKLQHAFHDAGDVGIGAGRGVASTAGNVGGLEYAMMPKGVQNSSYGKDFSEGLDTLKDWANPKNIWQSIGKGAEQIGEFLVPGGAEEDAARGLVKAFPAAEKAAPLAKVFTGALSAGAVNKAQGGSFGAGAATGAATGALSEGFRALAPHVAESALNIRKLDRAYGRDPGRAILDETTGLRPSAIAKSAQQRLNVLNPQLEAAADRASMRPAPKIRGFLEPGAEEVPLHSSNAVEGTPSRPVVLHQPDRPMVKQLPPPTHETPMSSYADIFPEQLPNGQARIPRAFEGESTGMGPGDYVGQIAGERGGPGQVQGVWRPRPEMSASIPRAFEENPSASLSGARGELRHAFQTAANQGERTTVNQLRPMMTHLTEDINGQPINALVDPRKLLNLKRGFGSEFIHRWNPDTMEGVKGTAGRTYHQLAHAFEEAVPEAAPLNRRISSLIPVAKRAESAELNASTPQRVLHRISAHTGAGLGAVAGGIAGYRKGGGLGAVGGTTAGMLMPEAMMSPVGQMMIARGLNSGVPLRIARGAALQLDRTRKRAEAQ